MSSSYDLLKLSSDVLGPDDCEFGLDQYCNWENNQPNSVYKWAIHKGRTPSMGTGPTGDHTTGTGRLNSAAGKLKGNSIPSTSVLFTVHMKDLSYFRLVPKFPSSNQLS